MALSALDMFSIGLGPSSSHTVGPMRAAATFINDLDPEVLRRTHRAVVELFGSLGATGVGHHSDQAVVLGLAGYDPATIDVEKVDHIINQAKEEQTLLLAGTQQVGFDFYRDVVLHQNKSLPAHPNAMRCAIYDDQGEELAAQVLYSIGGGFVVTEDELNAPLTTERHARHEYTTGKELLAHCRSQDKSIDEIAWENEIEWRNPDEVRERLLEIWHVMQECVHTGLHRTEQMLPGTLLVMRRAPKLYAHLQQLLEEQKASPENVDPLSAMEWVNLYALAVNEENASGGRVVTAPTNGAAGIIPAVMHYFVQFYPEKADDDAIVKFLLTASAIGIIIKSQASISGAEVGCQGEVGSACAMAAAGLSAVLGGTPQQVEHAAEVALEHNLGLTCDPVGGLVQIPCIERNAIASVKAINAARMSNFDDAGEHRVSLDMAVETMRATGADMMDKYKETSRGGLAVTVRMPDC